MICEGCRPEHTAAECIDTTAGREYPWRHCACQHHPRAARRDSDPTPEAGSKP